ncbi:MAG: hypothetical protein FWG28_08370 [Clostridiales bacterium]|nr:hypothetical protein [Clostridiales bacterium]
MKHHYIVYARMKYNAVCRFGTVCAEEDFHAVLARKNIVGYKMISIDDEEVSDWKEKDWTML